MAADLKKEPGLDVQLINGNRGEFSVSVDGHTVAQKQGDAMPTTQEVLAAVRQTAPAGAQG
ncbi:MAG TPA: hypothetical protein VFA18_02200 [Gemmataceae bacterium]|nr:hypothetical protein [Gemmataceae bacterium]